MPTATSAECSFEVSGEVESGEPEDLVGWRVCDPDLAETLLHQLST